MSGVEKPAGGRRRGPSNELIAIVAVGVALGGLMVASLSDVRSEIRHQTSSLRDAITRLDDRVRGLEVGLGLVEVRLVSVEERLGGVEERLGNVEIRLTDVEIRLTDVEIRLTDVEEGLNDVKVRLTDVEGRLTDVEGRLTDVEGRLTDVEGRLTDVEAGAAVADGALRREQAKVSSGRTGGLAKSRPVVADVRLLVPTCCAAVSGPPGVAYPASFRYHRTPHTST